MQAFIRYTRGLGNAALGVRVTSLTGAYWNFVTLGWDALESLDTAYNLTEYAGSDPNESTYTRTLVLPSAVIVSEGFVEIFVKGTGEVIGQESLSYFRTQAAVNALEFNPDGDLVVGVNLDSVITIPSLSGAVYSPTVVQGQKISVIKNDTPTITGILNNDYSGGWTADLTLSMESPVVLKIVLPCVWLDAATGAFKVDLSTFDTDVVGQYDCSVKVYNAPKRLTALRFTLTVVKDT